MSLAQFRVEPWKSSHDAYENSVFNIRPAPEFATAEVVVASLYRSCGFDGHQEKDVPATGRDFDKASQQPVTHKNSGSQISLETWRSVLHEILESPKQPNQSSKRFLQLCPVVPDVALYSGSARLSGNSWNPGLLIQRLVCIGSESQAQARDLWKRLFTTLSVNSDDDVWARWLEAEFGLHRRMIPGSRPTSTHSVSLPSSSLGISKPSWTPSPA
jgi:hypothetical protein